MVMEASPSPQSVGREFVRQYYTLLNKAPAHLHRFYNNFSSFVHGGLDAPNRETLPVIGQKQIHNRIQQLNFRDCHAKITQVDSQATLCNSVVVQVTGELSNAGAPMRRFTQTFVLAEQSPKKYYVHNDIFRYQDMLSDEEGEVEDNHSETEDEPLQPMQPLSISAPPTEQVPPGAYFPPAFVPPAALAPHVPAINGLAVAVAKQEVAPPPQIMEVPAVQLVQGLQNAPIPPMLAVAAEEVPEIVAVPEKVEEVPREAESVPEPEPPQKSPEPILPPVAPVPKTYANLLKSGGPSAFQQPATQRFQPNTYTAPVSRSQPPAATSSPPAPGAQRPRMQRPPRQDNNERDSNNSGGGRRPFSDSLQLFLGNVPSNATEEELRSMFGRFGSIAELRVLSKSGPPSSLRQHSNYGFVTYDDAQAVQNCLNARPLHFPPDNPSGQVLNVEEKRARSRDMGGAGPSAGGGAGGGPPRGGGGAGRGPRGAPRAPFGTARGPPSYRR